MHKFVFVGRTHGVGRIIYRMNDVLLAVLGALAQQKSILGESLRGKKFL